MRNYIKQNPGGNSEKELTFRVMTRLIGSPLFPTVEEHINSHHHDTNLVRLVVERYLRIRFFYESKKITFLKLWHRNDNCLESSYSCKVIEKFVFCFSL